MSNMSIFDEESLVANTCGKSVKQSADGVDVFAYKPGSDD